LLSWAGSSLRKPRSGQAQEPAVKPAEAGRFDFAKSRLKVVAVNRAVDPGALYILLCIWIVLLPPLQSSNQLFGVSAFEKLLARRLDSRSAGINPFLSLCILYLPQIHLKFSFAGL
jgi:hypothetical protein